eukprot:Skav229406  [mRNA]  locus=scaffold2297:57030:57755:+ [translate_table: standard]
MKPEGFQLDHLGLAVNDLEQGIAKIQEVTGVKPMLHPPEPGAPFQSASLKIGQKTFLEILGPNSAHSGVHPLKSLLRTMPPGELTLWFWYVGTDQFEKMESKIAAAGRCIENKVVQDDPGTSGEHSTYVRGQIGPGFDPVYPNLIQWKTPPTIEVAKDMEVCPLKDFTVVAADHKAASEFFEKVGINTSTLRPSDNGKSYLILTIETPKGAVEFKSEARSLTMMGVLSACFQDMRQQCTCC